MYIYSYQILMSPTTNPLYAIALDIVEMCRKEEYLAIYDKYYTEKTRSVEALSFDWSDPVTVGITALKKKVEKWNEMCETVSLEVWNPSIVNGNQFIVRMEITTKKPGNTETKKDSEYVLYTIEDGKVIEEKFFYCM